MLVGIRDSRIEEWENMEERSPPTESRATVKNVGQRRSHKTDGLAQEIRKYNSKGPWKKCGVYRINEYDIRDPWSVPLVVFAHEVMEGAHYTRK